MARKINQFKTKIRKLESTSTPLDKITHQISTPKMGQGLT